MAAAKRSRHRRHGRTGRSGSNRASLTLNRPESLRTMSPDEPQLSPSQLADLSALADGTIEPARREAVQSWVSSSPAVQEAYGQQRLVVSAVAQVRSDRAPASLRARIERDRQRHRAPAPRRVRLGLIAVPVAAVVVIVALAALPAGTPGAPSISQAAALAQLGPQQSGPGADARDPRVKLRESVQDVYFPNWATRLGWHAVGERRDRLGGHLAVTVYYAKGGRRVAYTILGKPALPQPSAAIRRLSGFQLRTLADHGRTIVTWRRLGHTCVISAAGVPVHVLQTLAAWRWPGGRPALAKLSP
jgi:hypothetical protein